MHLLSRATRFAPLKVILAATLLIAPSLSQAGQDDSAIANRDPWLYKGSDITPDPAWHFGTLKNGLRYAVRKNGVPPGQISIRVRIDAGSLYEQDSERGFAHLIEHLSFRGSVYVPDGEAKRIWQRMGTTFGSDTNAQTTTTQTVYKLDLPAATPEGIDQSIKIMSGMVSQPNITQAALTGERPAVLAEQREQPGPQVRFMNAINGALFAGQPLADRSPIGNIKTLEAATPETVRAFHDRWYRPERTLVSIAGDFDPAMIEPLIAKYFGTWKGTGPAPADPDFGTPDAKQPATGAITEPGLPTRIAFAVVRPWKYNDDTVVFNQNRLVDQVALAVINRRLETRARTGGSFIAAQAALDDPSRSANVTLVTILPVGNDWEPALRDVRAVIADAQVHPATQAEIDRELADTEVTFRTLVETARAEAGSKEADDMVQAVDIRETTTAPSTIQKVFQDARAKKMFTPARILASTKKVFEGTAQRALISLQVPEDGAAAKLATALSADVSGLAGKRRAQANISFSKLPPLGKPGALKAPLEKINRFGPDMNLSQGEFTNGVRLMVYSTKAEDNRIYVRVRFGGGYAALPADKPTPAWAAELALVQGGIGKLGQGDLDALTAGRRMGLDFDIEDDAFSLSGQTSPADFNDQLKLLASELNTPGWDPNPLARGKSVALAGYAGYDSSPDGVLSRDLERLLRDGDQRWGTPSREQISGTTPEAFRALWEPLMKTGPIEVQVFGDVTPEDAVLAVGKTFGALKPRPAIAEITPPVRFPAHNTTPVTRTHDGPENQAAAVIAWPTGGGLDEIADARRLDVLAAIFSDRLFDKLRSEAGASYSPNVSSSWPAGLPGGGRMVAIGQVAPNNIPLFFKLSREIAADLVANPVSDDELKRTLGPMQQSILRQSTGNQFWMLQLTGASYDPRRIDALAGLYGTLTRMTAADVQATAARYLRPDKDWTLQVVPKAAPAK
ncbi:M16 family metallopeptidase [Sphingomonas immobilis]|uniref:Insulinase family protein n=1 Tax=Sphingomonas immobilis TaxID=3063997 RepID=A0ABT9A1I9_9SPHN|nr:insulinase family protein [Sphingomonas sp. CA1-15]MDO7843332.1 insulinase family protein [Sphingomonas sp. CA1-15]